VYNQLIYQYGGIDLSTYYKFPNAHFIYFEDLMALFMPVMEGLNRMGEKRMAHVDIKPENMLLDLSIPKVYLIDFGLSTSFDLLRHEHTFHEHDYPYYPPEFKILSQFTQGSYDPDVCYDLFMKNFQFYHTSQFIQWVEQRWPTYTNEIRDFLQVFTRHTHDTMLQEFESKFVQKLDSYSLAMTIVEIIYRLDTSKNLTLKNTSNDFIGKMLSQLLFPMIRPDAYQRMTISEAIRVFYDILYSKIPSHIRSPEYNPKMRSRKIPLASPPSPVKPPVSLGDCLVMKTRDIQMYLKHFKLPVSGTKTILCNRLMNYLKIHPPYSPVRTP
jgi:serine/threonine protein kinase